MDHPDHGAAAAAEHGLARSPHWPHVEKAFRKAHPHCVACAPDASDHAVQVHHRAPFHYVVSLGRPDLELDPRNLVSLCETEEGKPAEDHHLLIGHLGNFRAGNLEVLEDAATTFHGMTSEAIRSDPRWLDKEKNGRIKPLDEMTDDEKAAFRVMLDVRFPLAVSSVAA